MKAFFITLIGILTAAFSVPAIAKNRIATPHEAFYVISQTEEDRIEYFDKVVVESGSHSTDIFCSGGRQIEKILLNDLNQDKIPELLVQMDLGGSGGFKEFALLRKVGNNYIVIWEETGYRMAEAFAVKSQNQVASHFKITHLDTDKDTPEEVISLLFLVDGQVVKRQP